MTESAEDEGQAPLRIDIVSDVVCPWCIIGYKQLEAAQAATGVPAVVYWHPFELNPEMPEAGEDLFAHIAGKYGSTREQSLKARDKLTALGAELGFVFDYAEDMRMVNSFRAHQLLHWAGPQGRQHPLKMTLFAAFFGGRGDVNDPAVLVQAAAEAGLDPSEAEAVLSDGRFAAPVREHEAFWTSRGVQGVPTMILDGRQALVGAQGVANYAAALTALAAERGDGA